jgi:hypothetical protein
MDLELLISAVVTQHSRAEFYALDGTRHEMLVPVSEISD